MKTRVDFGRMVSNVAAAALLGATACVCAAAQSAPSLSPRITHAQVEEREIKAGLAPEVDRWAAAAEKAQWLGYAVPAAAPDRSTCCGGRGGEWTGGRACGPCQLEGSPSGDSYHFLSGEVKLEGPGNLVILFRAQGRKIGKIRAVSEDCVLDAGGLQMTWLTGAKPSESVQLLERFVNSKEFDERDGEGLSRGALMAIALHGDASADQALAAFTRPDQPESMRKEAAFWAGEARDGAGVELLKRMAREDASSEVRAQVTFALSISKENNALDEMIRMAHQDQSGHVRGQALFWLAQKAGKRAASAITGAIENDPDTEVKKKAVFALSQMPKDDGVPKLIQVAETNRNPEVRKQAMFWLGQSNDPRALDFFEKVLAK